MPLTICNSSGLQELVVSYSHRMPKNEILYVYYL